MNRLLYIVVLYPTDLTRYLSHQLRDTQCMVRGQWKSTSSLTGYLLSHQIRDTQCVTMSTLPQAEERKE